MRRVRLACGLVLLLGASAAGQNLVFTTRTPLNCPASVSQVKASREYGFQTAIFRNESKRTLDSLRLQVTVSSESGEEIVETADFLVRLASGESKRLELGMGRVRELHEKARLSRRPVFAAILSVVLARFADGDEWSAGDRLIYDPRR